MGSKDGMKPKKDFLGKLAQLGCLDSVLRKYTVLPALAEFIYIDVQFVHNRFVHNAIFSMS